MSFEIKVPVQKRDKIRSTLSTFTELWWGDNWKEKEAFNRSFQKGFRAHISPVWPKSPSLDLMPLLWSMSACKYRLLLSTFSWNLFSRCVTYFYVLSAWCSAWHKLLPNKFLKMNKWRRAAASSPIFFLSHCLVMRAKLPLWAQVPGRLTNSRSQPQGHVHSSHSILAMLSLLVLAAHETLLWSQRFVKRVSRDRLWLWSLIEIQLSTYGYETLKLAICWAARTLLLNSVCKILMKLWLSSRKPYVIYLSTSSKKYFFSV